MKASKFITFNKIGVSIDEIVKFEQEYNLAIPEQYRELLLQSNGAKIAANLQHPLDERWKLVIYSELSSINGLKDGFLYFESLNKDGLRFQYQNQILQICHTHDGPSIYIGYAEPVKNQVFIDEMDELTNEGEIPLHYIAASFFEFLEMLEPLSEE